MIGISVGLFVGSWGAAVVRRAGGSLLRQSRRAIRALWHRRDVMRLMELDDRALKDIGLLRTDVVGALDQPLHRDPSTILLLRSMEHRARYRAMGGDTPHGAPAASDAAREPGRRGALEPSRRG